VYLPKLSQADGGSCVKGFYDEEFPMTRIIVSGFFDPLQAGSLDYIKQAIELKPDLLICVIGSDEQLMMKKGKINFPENERQEIMDLVLSGLQVRYGVKYCLMINKFDTETIYIAKTLEMLQPDILFRGGDKNIDMMPIPEKNICEKLHIEIKHGEFRIDRHGSRMTL
jgi:glycerol-3-phosphate cytidylyltransferase-like family protein